LRRAYELCERIGNDRETVTILYQLGQFYIERSRFSEARKVAEQAVALADRAQDQILEAGAQEILGECCLWTGDLRTARACFERALALCQGELPSAFTQVYGFDLSILPRVCMSFTELLLGWPERALQWEHRTIERAQSCVDLYNQAFGLVLASWWRPLRGKLEGRIECLGWAREMCDEFHELAGWVKQLESWSYFSRMNGPLALRR
jgi:tetratricopeptide (TPR) repeat protein